eukprot:2545997-Pyramimonas_sp.AAC.1
MAAAGAHYHQEREERAVVAAVESCSAGGWLHAVPVPSAWNVVETSGVDLVVMDFAATTALRATALVMAT